MRTAKMIAVVALVLAGLCVVGTRRAEAQTLEAPRARQGYYVSVGLSGEAQASDDDGKSKTLVGSGFGIGLGQMLTPCFGLGIRIDTGSAKADGVNGSGGGLALEGQWNLWKQLSLHAGFGFGFTSLEDTKALEDETSGGYGALVTLAATYDFFFTSRLTGGWAVTPQLLVRALDGGDVDAVWFGLGVQLSWWSGRPRNELVLDEADAYK